MRRGKDAARFAMRRCGARDARYAFMPSRPVRRPAAQHSSRVGSPSARRLGAGPIEGCRACGREHLEIQPARVLYADGPAGGAADAKAPHAFGPHRVRLLLRTRARSAHGLPLASRPNPHARRARGTRTDARVRTFAPAGANARAARPRLPPWPPRPAPLTRALTQRARGAGRAPRAGAAGGRAAGRRPR